MLKTSRKFKASKGPNPASTNLVDIKRRPSLNIKGQTDTLSSPKIINQKSGFGKDSDVGTPRSGSRGEKRNSFSDTKLSRKPSITGVRRDSKIQINKFTSDTLTKRSTEEAFKSMPTNPMYRTGQTEKTEKTENSPRSSVAGGFEEQETIIDLTMKKNLDDSMTFGQKTVDLANDLMNDAVHTKNLIDLAGKNGAETGLEGQQQ